MRDMSGFGCDQRPVDPILVEVEQFNGLDDALLRIRQDKPFDDLAHKVLQTFVDRGASGTRHSCSSEVP